MKRILFLLLILIPLISCGQGSHKSGVVVSDSLRMEGFIRIIDSLLSEGFSKFDGDLLLSSGDTLNYITVNGSDTIISINGTEIPFGDSFMGTIDHNTIVNYVANEHIDHSSIAITGTQSIAGGGDLTANVSLSLVSDEGTPGNNEYYGTDEAGTKGYQGLLAAMERLIPGISLITNLEEIDEEILRFHTASRYYDVYAPVSGDSTNIYLSQIGGDNNNDGFSIATPIKDLDYLLANFYIDPNDSIFLNSGDTWRLTSDWDITWRGASGNHWVITRYGEGDKPRILGSAIASGWTNHGSNRWRSNNIFSGYDPGASDDHVFFIELDDSVKWGVYEPDGLSELDSIHKFYESNDTVYVYSTSDPSSAYNSVEVTMVANLMELQTGADSAEYGTIDGIEWAFFGDIAIRVEYPGGVSVGRNRALRGLEVRNCHIHHGDSKGDVGFGIYSSMSDVIIEDNEINDMGRRGVNIGLDNNTHADTLENILIQDNDFHDSWHTNGPDIQNEHDAVIFENIVIRRNKFENDLTADLGVDQVLGSTGIYIANSSTGGINNIEIYNNLIINRTSSGIVLSEVDTAYAHNNTFFGNHSDCQNCTGIVSIGSDSVRILNNIIHQNYDNERIIWLEIAGADKLIVDYNLYHDESSDNDSWRYEGADYTYTNYVTASSQEGNSPTPVDPLFVNAPTNLKVYSNSDAIDGGVDIPGYDTDHDEVAVGSPPNIGAYETDGGAQATYYVATDGDDSDPGTISEPFATWDKLDDVMVAGDIAYIRGGTYTLSNASGNRVYWNNLNGTSVDTIKIYNYPGETPILSASGSGTSTCRMVRMENSEYVHIKGLKIFEVNQNPVGNLLIGFTMYNNNSNCVIENCVVDSLDGIGFVTQNSTDMLFLNCDASHLKDPYSGSPYGGADGFVIWGDVGNTRTTYKGCRAWFCSDDGFDRFIDTTYTVYDSCWAFWNGYTHDYVHTGDGNGFKLGPAPWNRADTSDVLVTNCIAASNKLSGFNENSGSNQSSHKLFNNFAYATHTGRGFHYGYGSDLTYDTARNNVSYVEGLSTLFNGTLQVDDYNSWNGGVTVTDADFISLDTMLLDNARQADGSLPVINFGKLVNGSDLIDAGIEITYPIVIPYYGTDPDMGYDESNYAIHWLWALWWLIILIGNRKKFRC